MNIRYSAAFVEQALIKAYNREGRSITSVADDLSVNVHTLRYWMKNRTGIDRIVPAKSAERRPQDWSAEEQLSALNETYGLTGETLQTWCREKGLYAHHLAGWKTAFCTVSKDAAPSGRELRDLKDENVKLKRDVARKDKALAEAAALLILQKKFRALWDEEGK
jgi:transposase-like protein